MAGKGPKPRPGFDPKKYRESSLWDNFGPDKKEKKDKSRTLYKCPECGAGDDATNLETNGGCYICPNCSLEGMERQ